MVWVLVSGTMCSVGVIVSEVVCDVGVSVWSCVCQCLESCMVWVLVSGVMCEVMRGVVAMAWVSDMCGVVKCGGHVQKVFPGASVSLSLSCRWFPCCPTLMMR